MYRLLLPLDANAGRHIEHDRLPQRGAWSGMFHAGWGMVVHFFAAVRR
jgi:hypothetical protein